MTWPRVVAPETLDHLAPDDPAARRSRRDLLRVHSAMGTRAILARRWQQLLAPDRSGAPLHILELGAGDGRLLLRVAADLAPVWPPVHLRLLDRQDIVDADTLNGFARLGWNVRVEVSDVHAWATRPPPAPPDTPSARWDLITTTLFLHHFQNHELHVLLAAAAERCDRFLACEPRRSWGALAGSHLVGALGANAVTREDAVLSVRAGFCDDEISARWPQPTSAGPGSAPAIDAASDDGAGMAAGTAGGAASHSAGVTAGVKADVKADAKASVTAGDTAGDSAVEAAGAAAVHSAPAPALTATARSLRAAKARQAKRAASLASATSGWHLQESAVGLFSHCFSARRAGGRT